MRPLLSSLPRWHFSPPAHLAWRWCFSVISSYTDVMADASAVQASFSRQYAMAVDAASSIVALSSEYLIFLSSSQSCQSPCSIRAWHHSSFSSDQTSSVLQSNLTSSSSGQS